MYQLKIPILLLFYFCCASDQKELNWWHKKASMMVKNQIEKRGVQDEGVLRVMRDTPRHLFIPENLKEMAYEDGPLPIGEGQTISQPYIVALMTELLQLEGNERVLEIGTGSGYQAAVLSEVALKVFTVERIKELAKQTKILLEHYSNKKIKVGNGYKG